jgi:hypothetical protein
MANSDTTLSSGAHVFFADIIPNLAFRAKDYNVEIDVIDEEITALYAAQIRDMTKRLAAACRDRDQDVVREQAHSLEGTGGTMGFPEISIVGWELSLAAKGPDWVRCTLFTERLSLWSKTLA